MKKSIFKSLDLDLHALEIQENVLRLRESLRQKVSSEVLEKLSPAWKAITSQYVKFFQAVRGS